MTKGVLSSMEKKVERGPGAQVGLRLILQNDENADVSKAQDEDNAEGQATSAGWNPNDGQSTGSRSDVWSVWFQRKSKWLSGMEWNQSNGFNPMMQMQMQNNMPNGVG